MRDGRVPKQWKHRAHVFGLAGHYPVQHLIISVALAPFLLSPPFIVLSVLISTRASDPLVIGVRLVFLETTSTRSTSPPVSLVLIPLSLGLAVNRLGEY